MRMPYPAPRNQTWSETSHSYPFLFRKMGEDNIFFRKIDRWYKNISSKAMWWRAGIARPNNGIYTNINKIKFCKIISLVQSHTFLHYFLIFFSFLSLWLETGVSLRLFCFIFGWLVNTSFESQMGKNLRFGFICIGLVFCVIWCKCTVTSFSLWHEVTKRVLCDAENCHGKLPLAPNTHPRCRGRMSAMCWE